MRKTFSKQERPQASLQWRERPGPLSDGQPPGSLVEAVNPLLGYPRAGDGVGGLICLPLTTASCSCLSYHQLLDLHSALAGLHFHCFTSVDITTTVYFCHAPPGGAFASCVGFGCDSWVRHFCPDLPLNPLTS